MEIKTPRPFYFKCWVVQFNVKNKKLFYEVLHWNDEGTNLALITKGKYNGEDPKSLIPIYPKGEQE